MKVLALTIIRNITGFLHARHLSADESNITSPTQGYDPSVLQAASLPDHHDLLSTIVTSDYGCYIVLFMIACILITLIIYSYRRHYPDHRIWP